MSMIERRHQPREAMSLDVTLAHPRHGTLRGRLRNYSIGGMYITLDADTGTLHGVVTLRIYRDDVMLVVRGLIVHKDGGGIGVMVIEAVTVVDLYGDTVDEVVTRTALA